MVELGENTCSPEGSNESMVGSETVDIERTRDEQGCSVEEYPSCGDVGGCRETLQQIIDCVVFQEDWERIIEKMVELAEDGDVEAARLLFEYAFGKPVQTIELSLVTSYPE